MEICEFLRSTAKFPYLKPDSYDAEDRLVVLPGGVGPDLTKLMRWWLYTPSGRAASS